jgi:hypothetical protein
MKEYLKFLGLKVEDKVTKFKGVVISVSFDLFGCIQVLVEPGLDEKGNFGNDRVWLDINRLKIINKKPMMPIPDYTKGYQAEAKQGAADKPTNI